MSRPFPSLPTVSDLIRLYKLSAREQLSQNFLLDLNITDKMARSAGDLRNSVVLEVGPGPGSLTRSLLKLGAKKVIVVEKDSRFIPSLEGLAQAAEGRLSIVHGDMLKIDEATLLQQYNPDHDPVKMVGNLPFNVATPLLLKWLRLVPEKKGPFMFGKVPMVLLFQSEVADRIVAQVGTKPYTRLSIMTQRVCSARSVFQIKGASFVPAPKVGHGASNAKRFEVNATAVYIEPLDHPVEPIVSTAVVEYVCKTLFHQRRKKLSNSFKNLGPEYLRIAQDANIDLDKRPENLTITEWNTIALHFEKLGQAQQMPGQPNDDYLD